MFPMALSLVLATHAAAPAPPSAGPSSSPVPIAGGTWQMDVSGALGAQALVWVGEDADLRQGDLARTETVRLAQGFFEAGFRGPAGAFANFRVEEGVLGPAGLEAAEAWVGLSALKGRAGAWVGRNDLPVTRDRKRENDQLALSWRPHLSRTLWPVHPTGAGAGLGIPGRASLQGGASYAQLNADAPLLWARADLSPLGPVPARQGERVQGAAFALGGGLLRQSSPSRGETRFWTADAEVRVGPAEVSGAWLRHAERPGTPGERVRSEWIASVGSTLLSTPNSALFLHLRGERVVGLDPDGAARWLPGGRLGWRGAGDAVEVYGEGHLSFEEATARENGLAAAGMRVRW